MSRKIYFCGSISGGRQDAELYKLIIKTLHDYGRVLTEHVGEIQVGDIGDPAHIHDRDLQWLRECDAVVAEVTQTSMGVGYELGRAYGMGKNILCLFRPNTGKRISAMIQGAHNGSSFIVKHYSSQEEFPAIIRDFFDQISTATNIKGPTAAKQSKTDETVNKSNVQLVKDPTPSRKIYFCGSIRGGRQDQSLYAKIIAELKANYGPVLTEHVGYQDQILKKKDGGCEGIADAKIHEVDMNWLNASTDLVAEVTQVSAGVGYEIGRAREMGKRILCIFRPQPDKNISAMIQGAHNGSSFTVKPYKDDEYINILKEFFPER